MLIIPTEHNHAINSYDIQYSLIIAIEKNTQLILSNSKKITIPINGMIMFRGDYQHAGASYIKSNHRIFASCSNHPLIGIVIFLEFDNMN